MVESVPFAALAVGAEGTFRFAVTGLDSTAAALDLVDDGVVVGSVTVTLATGAIAGSFPNLGAVSVEVDRQHFVRGDIVEHVSGAIWIVFSQAADNTVAYVGPGGTSGVPTGDLVKIGHCDADAAGLPA